MDGKIAGDRGHSRLAGLEICRWLVATGAAEAPSRCRHRGRVVAVVRSRSRVAMVFAGDRRWDGVLARGRGWDRGMIGSVVGGIDLQDAMALAAVHRWAEVASIAVGRG
jgi:hypothetical protein